MDFGEIIFKTGNSVIPGSLIQPDFLLSKMKLSKVTDIPYHLVEYDVRIQN